MKLTDVPNTVIKLADEGTILKKLLITRGIPKQLFASKPFKLKDAISSFNSEVEGLKPKTINQQKQFEFLHKIFLNPYIYLVSLFSMKFLLNKHLP